MAKLNEAEKHEIVRLHARFTSTRDVVAHIQAEFGIEIDRFQVRSYDPANPRFEGGERWRSIFEAEREAYLRSVEGVPIAHQAFRLNQLQEIFFKAKAAGNLVLANATLEQAAKEVGGLLTNERRLGAPAEPGWRSMTSEERRAKVIDTLRRAMEKPQERQTA